MTNKNTAVIIDDDPNSISALKLLLSDYKEDFEVVGTADSVEAGVLIINKLKPDLVFLDIVMPDGQGFEVIERTEKHDYDIIFITSHNDYAVRAFEFSAIHYLLKPIDPKALSKALERYLNKLKLDDINEKIRILKLNLHEKPRKILLPSNEGMTAYDIKDIIKLRADSNYTTLFFTESRTALVSKPLINFDKSLTDLDFVRVHSKYIINLNYIKKYVKGKSPYLILSDESEIPISESRKAAFLDKLNKFANLI
ncbi:response regulator transcription factor [bacterium]|nr:response regulator transcription factor [bacterium]